MSVKNNGYLAAALALMGLGLTAGREAVSETLLDNITVSNVRLVQVTDKGGAVAVVDVATGAAGAVEIRAVATSKGDVKLFSGLDVAASFVKRIKMAANTEVTYLRMTDTATATSPIARLKSDYKAAKAEKLSSAATVTQLNALIAAAESAGDDEAAGTPNYFQWQDYGKRKITVQEINVWATARETELATALTAAGVDPLTVV